MRQRLKTLQSNMPHGTVVVMSIAMILTGCLFPLFSSYGDPLVFTGQYDVLQNLGSIGFLLWCAWLALSGIGYLLRPKFWLAWIMPLVTLTIGVYGHLALTGNTATAFIYYLAALILPTVWHFRLYPDVYAPIRRFMPNGLLNLKITQWFAVPMWLMVFVLTTNPQSAGMGLLYRALGLFVDWAIDPIICYQFLYVITAILLTFPIHWGSSIRYFLFFPFILHGVIFGSITLFYTGVYSLTPLFVAITYLWLREAGYVDD